MRYEGKISIVTGAGSGFGEAIAKRFASEGAATVVADIDEESGARVASEIRDAGGRALFLPTDVSQNADMQKLFEASVEEYGGIDVIVNNAGVPHRSTPMVDLPESEFDRVFAINVKSVYLSAVHGVPRLRERGGGAIVNIASIGAIRPRPSMTAYNATKGAVMTLTRGLATELAPDIRVNAVNPLASETGFMKGALGLDSLPAAVRESLTKGVPLGRLTHPKDVATAVLFLASDEAEFLTGVCLDVDGGKSIV